jgi:hypothetical protein
VRKLVQLPSCSTELLALTWNWVILNPNSSLGRKLRLRSSESTTISKIYLY